MAAGRSISASKCKRYFLKRAYVLLTLLIVTLVAAVVAEPATLIFRIYFWPPRLSLPARLAPRDLADSRRQDIADLRLLPEFDRSFSADAKAAFARGADRLEADAGTLSDAGFEMAVSRLVALARNAHTTVDKAQRVALFGRAPLRFAWFADGLYVVRTLSMNALLGRQVLSIDGRPVEQALADLRPYISGTAERARDDSPPLFDCPALLQAIWPDTDGEHLTVALADGGVERLAALPAAPDPFASRPIMVIGAGSAGGDWKTVLGALPQPPLSLRDPDRVAYSAALDDGVLYVRINANEDDANGSLPGQLAAIAAGKPPFGWRRIVLDLRFNDGGDERKTMAFTRALPDLLTTDGQLWILTGKATFSAGIITVARAKYFVGPRAHIVGETVGDHNPFWSDGGPALVLRNSRIAINHAYLKQDWMNGCRTLDCNPIQFLYGVAERDLSPEIAIGWSFADYAAGRDTVMDRIR